MQESLYSANQVLHSLKNPDNSQRIFEEDFIKLRDQVNVIGVRETQPDVPDDLISLIGQYTIDFDKRQMKTLEDTLAYQIFKAKKLYGEMINDRTHVRWLMYRILAQFDRAEQDAAMGFFLALNRYLENPSVENKRELQREIESIKLSYTQYEEEEDKRGLRKCKFAALFSVISLGVALSSGTFAALAAGWVTVAVLVVCAVMFNFSFKSFLKNCDPEEESSRGLRRAINSLLSNAEKNAKKIENGENSEALHRYHDDNVNSPKLSAQFARFFNPTLPRRAVSHSDSVEICDESSALENSYSLKEAIY